MSFHEELKRIYKTSDMMISCHSKLRDEYLLKSLFADVSLLTFSVTLVAFTFVSQAFLSHTFYGVKISYLVKFFSLAVFISSLIQLKFDWRTKVIAHSDAAKAYFMLKDTLKVLFEKKEKINVTEYEDVKKLFANLGKYNIHIPDSEYLRLKHYHQVKKYISHYLDEHPGASPFLLKFILTLKENLKVLLLKPEPKHIEPRHIIEPISLIKTDDPSAPHIQPQPV